MGAWMIGASISKSPSSFVDDVMAVVLSSDNFFLRPTGTVAPRIHDLDGNRKNVRLHRAAPGMAS
jgi:hypothetical protein